MIKEDFRQSHFIVYELVLPYCTACTPTINNADPWYTPVTCEESSDSEYSLFFVANDAPLYIPRANSHNFKSILNSTTFRCVNSETESTAKLKPGEGLSSRGTMSIKCTDFDGDPGPINFSESGTFFGKLLARNILDGKKILSHYYTVANGDTEEVSTSTHFIESTELSNGQFSLSAKDALKDIEAFSQRFPEPSEITLTADINETTTTIPVSDASSIGVGSVFRIDDELVRVQSKAANNITVFARGSSLVNPDTTVVYKTNVSEHSADSTVQPCYVMSKSFLPDILLDIFNSSGLNAYTNYAQWVTEIEEWNQDANLYGVFSEPLKVSGLLNRLLSAYLVDMWLDQPSQLIVVSAVSAWKESIRIITEDNDLSDLKIKTVNTQRVSRAFMYNKKDFKAENEDVINYSKLTLATDVQTESSDFYGDIKVHEFDNNDFISTSSATQSTARYVQRFSRTPKELTFTMEERKLASTKISDIVDIVSRDSQDAAGNTLQARDRCQIIRVQPNLNSIGRQYKVTALSYVPLIASNPGEELTIRLTGTLFDVNLFDRAGAPNIPINVTFIFDGCTIGSTASNVPAVRAGNFEIGSRVIIICTNNTEWSAKGGDGGSAGTGYSGFLVNSGFAKITSTPTDGGDSYQSDSIESHVYLNYTPISGEVPDSTLYAAGGGGAAGGAVAAIGDNRGTAVSNTIIAGGGGSGIPAGLGKTSTYVDGFFASSVIANNGTFSSAGVGDKVSDGSVSVSVFNANTSANGNGNGGFSLDGGDVTSLFATVSSSGGGITYASNKTLPQNGGLAGGAFKGSNITVYCLSAQLSKLKEGNSDPFTLITV